MELGIVNQVVVSARCLRGAVSGHLARCTLLVRACTIVVFTALLAESASAEPTSEATDVARSADASLAAAKLELAQANRILAHEGILDALGHLSVRDPSNPKRFLITRQLSAALVMPNDIVAVNLNGEASSPLLPNQSLFWERYIHAAIYEKRPDIVAVLHSHTPSVLPFSVSSTPFRPVVHNAAMLGEQLHVWDMRKKFGDTNLLVTDMTAARDLADCVASGTGCLMRAHGVVLVSKSVKEVVWYAMAMDLNAKTLATVHTLGGKTTYLSTGEVAAFAKSQQGVTSALERQWNYWLSRADLSGLE